MLEHLSWSSMNSFDNDIHSFYTRYVLLEEPVYCENVKKAMEFGKVYELNLMENQYKNRNTQQECELIIGGYKLYGLFDFFHEQNKDIVEVKTKSWWRTDDDIHKSWQFRFYNHRANKNWFRFMLHQYNKKEQEVDIKTINRDDKEFEKDFIAKAQQIERFLNQFNIQLQHYDIQKDK